MEYYTDGDYGPPSSPGLVAKRVNLSDLGPEAYGLYESDTDEELDINSPWAPALRSTTSGNSKRRRFGSKLARWRPSRKDGLLIQMMAPELGSTIADEVQLRVLPEDLDDDVLSSPEVDHDDAPPTPSLSPATAETDSSSTSSTYDFEPPPSPTLTSIDSPDYQEFLSLQLPSSSSSLSSSPSLYSPDTISDKSELATKTRVPTWQEERDTLRLAEEQDTQRLAPSRVRRSTRGPRTRVALPLIIRADTESSPVMSCPDTGSVDNIISLELATSLGLPLEPSGQGKPFSLANGKVVRSVASSSFSCSFVGLDEATVAVFECLVYVFESLVVPVIMGATFLEEAEVFTKYKDLLVQQTVPSVQMLRVNSLGIPRKGLVCRIDTFVGCANADTGSDVDLISPAFAKQRGLQVFEEELVLEFADGSTAYTSGSVKASFAIGEVDSVRGFIPRGNPIEVEFFVLDTLSFDILVGQDTLEELEVLHKHDDLFVNGIPEPGLSDCNFIRYIGKLESAVKSTVDTVRNALLPSRRLQLDTNSPPVREEQERLLAIQRSNAIKEGHSPTSTGQYVCEVPGCNALPFQTQYLLNSHANLHSTNRPHYCPVQGCPRSEGGKGFKRKNEMIRHGLIHESPGYTTCNDMSEFIIMTEIKMIQLLLQFSLKGQMGRAEGVGEEETPRTEYLI
ncbi:uncharacterized protein E0L32_001841 [Thyridium curvatum]|uniref:C2H2-type domain-containing protein n=1 Tax=Thyridium curvatum TaxID=1093900 RepID=A0A507ANQ1_9PEZI|nr:uncharacterized protein E0L32_001838 [Thyridium curvatum]XP_030989977.1 uncharacterized protein E0L32_001841 [Thyridium curvatum]TPX08263.1 hypothetical protein E0L32_001838 [Thyridium curvatum]TPX08266.1 hypothetical protein E0L32_001841 [Thyridium curvatum]